MIERARHLPRDGYTSMPWRNGAGTTQEIAREPAHGETFAWRLSLAGLQRSGPFSLYPGYQRAVALVAGRGFRLNISDARACVLATRGAHALFAGAAETACELFDGPCTDLSLMVREPGRIDAVTHLAIGADRTLRAAAGVIQVLFVLHGTIECHAYDPLAGCTSALQPHTLNVNDTLVIHGRGDSWSLRQASRAGAELLALTFIAPSDPTNAAVTSGARASAPPTT